MQPSLEKTVILITGKTILDISKKKNLNPSSDLQCGLNVKWQSWSYRRN